MDFQFKKVSGKFLEVSSSDCTKCIWSVTYHKFQNAGVVYKGGIFYQKEIKVDEVTRIEKLKCGPHHPDHCVFRVHHSGHHGGASPFPGLKATPHPMAIFPAPGASPVAVHVVGHPIDAAVVCGIRGPIIEWHGKVF
jgi:hypothetical protein